MSMTSMLLNREVPTFQPGLPRYINRPDANRRPILIATPELKTISDELQSRRNEAAFASISKSRHAVLDAIKAGAKTKKEIEIISRMSKSSVHNHTNGMAKDGMLIFNKSVSPWIVEISR